jgi:hypothetical protein
VARNRNPYIINDPDNPAAVARGMNPGSQQGFRSTRDGFLQLLRELEAGSSAQSVMPKQSKPARKSGQTSSTSQNPKIGFTESDTTGGVYNPFAPGGKSVGDTIVPENVRENPASPFTPYPGNEATPGMAFDDPYTAALMFLSNLAGRQIEEENPWAQIAQAFAGTTPMLWQLSGNNGTEGFDDFLNSFVGMLRSGQNGGATGNYSDPNNPLISWGELQTMLGNRLAGNNVSTANQGIFDGLNSQDPNTVFQTLSDLINSLGITGMNSAQRASAIDELKREQSHYQQYLMGGQDQSGVPSDFLDVLKQAGYFRDYFGI